jgi:hypothetical protein
VFPEVSQTLIEAPEEENEVEKVEIRIFNNKKDS